MLVIEGIVEEVIFRNESNGYTVAKLNTSDGVITIVGNAPFINLDEMVEIEGIGSTTTALESNLILTGSNHPPFHLKGD